MKSSKLFEMILRIFRKQLNSGKKKLTKAFKVKITGSISIVKN